MAAIEKLSVSELSDWLVEELKDEVAEESIEVLRENKVNNLLS